MQGNVLIYSGLMINTDWQWNDKQADTIVLNLPIGSISLEIFLSSHQNITIVEGCK